MVGGGGGVERGNLGMGRPNEARIWGQPLGFGEHKGFPGLTKQLRFHPTFAAVLLWFFVTMMQFLCLVWPQKSFSCSVWSYNSFLGLI